MADSPPTPTPKPSSNEQSTAYKARNEEQDMQRVEDQPSNPKRGKKSTFPISKRIEFSGALGIVVWVWSEMLETHDFHKLCVQWLVLVIFYVSVCYYIGKWIGHKAAGYAFFTAATIFTGIFAYTNSLAPSFSIIPREQYVEMKTPRYFMVVNFNGSLQRSPVNIIMFAQLTNLRDRALAINSYRFEGHTTNNTWTVMPTMDSKQAMMFAFVGTNWGTNGMGVVLGPVKDGDAVSVNFGEDVFPEILNGKIIVPGGTISGIFFLEAPTNGFDGQMRFRIKDSTDQEFVELVNPLQATNALRTRLQIGGGGIGIPTGENIKDMPIVPWSKNFN